jgi:hypothetical protein
MRTIVAATMALVIAWSVPPARAKEATPDFEVVTLMPLTAKVRVEADGRLGRFELTSPAPPEIRAGMGRLVGPWRFVPTIDASGQPVAVEADARLVLLARPVGDRFEVHVDNVTFSRRLDGPVVIDMPTARLSGFRMQPPRFPTGPLRQGLSALVVVAVRYASDGTVADAVVVQGALYEPRDKSTSTRQALRAFAQATLTAARHWTVTVDAHGVPTASDLTVVTPVHFGYSPEFKLELGQWRRLVRTPAVKVPWYADGQSAPGIADVSGADPVPLQAPLRLLHDPAGAKL